MRHTKAALGLLAGAGVLAIALPAFGQQSPQSILPPGFGAPPRPAEPTTPAMPPPPRRPDESPASEVPDLGLTPPPPAAGDDAADAAASAQAEADAANAQKAAEAAADALQKQDIPDDARRPVDHIGFLSTAVTGIPQDGFGDAPGGFLKTLMARLDAPVASRWVSMLLRRVLTTDIATPAGVDPGDWVAERALLLTRMGEADAARLLVLRLDPDHATPRYDAAVLQAALASADPGALCTVAEQADAATKDSPAWPLARAMCAGLQNEGGTASALVDRARTLPGAPSGLDLDLAQRVIGAGTDAKRAPEIRWSSVNDLTPWRFGLASALGIGVPDYLLSNAGLAMQAWHARAPMLSLADRLASEKIAATLGVMSSADLVDFVSQMAEGGDPYAMDDTPAGRLRRAFAAQDEGDRVAAMRAIWDDGEGERDAYAAHIMTARAAARITPSDSHASDVPGLLASMLSAGMDLRADRWADVVRGMKGTDGDEAWALLAVGATRPLVDIDADRIAGFGSGGRGSARLRAQFLFVSLAALGRLPASETNALAAKLDVPLGLSDSWTQAIDRAAARREPATVALLAAVGMQTTDWAQVPPVFLYHIIAGLRAAGFEAEARMVAAEALMRT